MGISQWLRADPAGQRPGTQIRPEVWEIPLKKWSLAESEYVSEQLSMHANALLYINR